MENSKSNGSEHSSSDDSNSKAKRKSHHWIFLRGLARHSGHWGDFPESFKAAFPNDPVEMLDIRGNGTQRHSPSFLSIAENVRDLRSRSAFLKQGHKVNLLTLSLGSMIGIEWAKLFPEDVASLTLINASSRTTSHFLKRMLPRNYKKFYDIATANLQPIEIERKLLDSVVFRLSDDKKQKLALKFSKTPLTSTANFTKQLFAASQFKLPDTKPNIPLLILGGQKDSLVDPSCTEAIAMKWRHPAIWHESAGHDIPVEDPEWVCEQLRDFLH